MGSNLYSKGTGGTKMAPKRFIHYYTTRTNYIAFMAGVRCTQVCQIGIKRAVITIRGVSQVPQWLLRVLMIYLREEAPGKHLNPGRSGAVSVVDESV